MLRPRTALAAARDAGFAVFEHLVFRSTAIHHASGEPTSVLIVRLDAIGDYVLWSSAATGLRQLYPEAKLTLIGNAQWADMAADSGLFDEVTSIEVRKFRKVLQYRYEVLGALRRQAYDLVLHPPVSRSQYFHDAEAIVGAARAGRKVAWANRHPVKILRWLSDSCYTQLFEPNPEHEHELERNAEFIRKLGYAGFRATVPKLRLSGSTEPTSDVGYVLAPGAGSAMRRWPPERFGALANLIYETSGWRGVLVGSTSERELCEQVIANSTAPLENRAGSTTLASLTDVFRRTRLVVCNDSSAVHMAAAVGTPAVYVLGGGHFGRFAPYPPALRERLSSVHVSHALPCFNCEWTCVRPREPDGPAECITLVSLEQVWLAVQNCLNTTRAAESRQEAGTRSIGP